MKVMIVPKLELQAALLVARLKGAIFWALHVTFDQVFMWRDSTTILQWINSNGKQPFFVANSVCEILEFTSVAQWNHVATKDNPVDSDKRGTPVEISHIISWVKCLYFLSNSSFSFVLIKGVIKNINLDVNQAVTIEDTASLATSVKKQTTPFRRYSHLKNSVIIKSTCAHAAYVLQLLPKHAGYRNLDGSITNNTELEVTELHLQYLVQGDSCESERKILFDNKAVKRSSRIAPHSPFLSPNGLIRSSGRINQLMEVGFNVTPNAYKTVA